MRSSSTKVAARENQGSLEDEEKSKWHLNWSGTLNSSGGQQSEVLICRNERTQPKNRSSSTYNTGDGSTTRGLWNPFLFCLGTAPLYFYKGKCCHALVSITFPLKKIPWACICINWGVIAKFANSPISKTPIYCAKVYWDHCSFLEAQRTCWAVNCGQRSSLFVP